jgi:hypothetical protein
MVPNVDVGEKRHIQGTPGLYEEQRALLRQAVAAERPYPEGRFSGRGIVICAGGQRLFTCAWVLIRMLRDRLGCTLPIEVWHLGPREMGPPMVAMLEDLDVAVVDAEALRRQCPVRRLGGWELKPYAVLNSRFEEVLLLDADNVPVLDPAFLFETGEFRATGALFWPDSVKITRSNPIWDICGLEYRDQPSFDAGQVVVDKRRCWAALNLTMHFNAYSDFYYDFVYGDKDTFYLAWRLLDQPYASPRSPDRSAGTLFHYDFDGRLLFQHRASPKWVLLARNPTIEGFQREDDCLGFIEDLRRIWDGWIFHPPARSDAAIALEDALAAQRRFVCTFVSSRELTIELQPGHRVAGARPDAFVWHVEDVAGTFELVFGADGREAARLRSDACGVWRGRLLAGTRVPIELRPAASEDVPDLENRADWSLFLSPTRYERV